MAVLPTRILEIEFDAGVWTDVTADLVDFATNRGRNKESGAFETGTLEFTLRNDTRKYDPDYAAGTYFGKLRPNRRVRFRATSTLTYPVFLGYIDLIRQQGQGPNAATAFFRVSDAFKLLNRVELPDSAYVAEVAQETPVSTWVFGEPVGSTTAKDSTGTRDLTYLDGPTLGVSGLAVRDPNTAASFALASLNRAGYTTGNLITGYPFTIEALINVPSIGGVSYQTIYMEDYGPTDKHLVFDVEVATGRLEFYIEAGGVTHTYARSSASVADGVTHHVAVKATAANAVTVYVDGVDVTAGTVTTANAFPTGTGRAAWGNWADGLVGRGLAGTLQYGAIYNTAIAGSKVAEHSAASKTPWNGDTSGARMTKIADLAAVPSGDRDIDAGSTTLQSTDLGGTALAYAQKIEETERGWLYVARDGKLTFRSRDNGITGTYLTSQLTLADDDSGVSFPSQGIPYRKADMDVDEARIVTRATVSREGSVAVTYYDAAAQAEFGWLDEIHEGLLHDSDTYSRAYAEVVVNTKKTPSSRVGTVVLTPAKEPTLWPLVLGLELVNRVTFKRKPQNVGAVISLAMRVEGIAHSGSGQDWQVELQLSPFGLGEGGYETGVWDVSLWDQATWGI